ncbi:hypothetical protein FCV62_06015 [Vibrio kanaloae]|uniref:Uncharacterized protein n=1 Tax=Vibrio kanaloae TaxID=170673 RepID=A0A4U2D1A5_9VIBR|nr:hypothetical protein FCV50_19225 [Vibrio kanaloae]TKF80601.1 hypothetical protein FCV62_06015 [Vibrio kanaloae]
MNKISSNRISYLFFLYLEVGCKNEKLFKISTTVLFLVKLLRGSSRFVTIRIDSNEKGALLTRNNAPLKD